MTMSASDTYNTILHNSLDFLGHRIIHTEGHERLEYWEKFQVRSPLNLLLLSVGSKFSSNQCNDVVIAFHLTAAVNRSFGSCTR